MQRFFFHVYEDHRRIEDREGTLCATASQARIEAIQSAKELARQAISRNASPLQTCLEIVDEKGAIIAALTVEEILAHPTTPRFQDTCEGVIASKSVRTGD